MSKLYVDEIENLNGSIKPVKNIVAKVDTIIDLLQIDTSKLETGEQFHVLGYHTRNDGGGGIFYWDADEDKANHNGGTIIDPTQTFPSDWSDTTQQETWFTANGTGNGCWKRVIGDYVTPEMFGAKGDGVTDDTKTIQRAVNMSHTLLPVELSAKTYIVSEPIIIDSTQVIRGKGKYLSVIKAADGSNIDVIKTKNFDSLTGQNKWFTSDGVVYGFELSHFQIDGNRDNQTSGNGIKIYGKGYRIDEVLIKNIKDVGFYSETGATGGQNDETDLPECIIGSLWIKTTGKDGFIYRGPHDGTIKHLVVADTGLDDDTTNGVSFQYLADTYNGSCDIEFIHEYASRGDGIYIGTPIKAGLLIGESNWKNGIYFDSVWGTYCEISRIQAYANDRGDTQSYWNVLIEGHSNKIGLLRIDNKSSLSAGGIKITGKHNEISGMLNRGWGASGTAVRIEANYTTINGQIWQWDGGGAIALSTPSEGINLCNINVDISEVNQFFDVYLSKRNIFNVRGYDDAAAFGTLSKLHPENEICLYIETTGVLYLSKNKGTATIHAGDTSVVVEHKLFSSPTTITLGQNSDLNGADLWVSSINSTSFTINISSAQTSDIYVKWYAEV